MTKVLVVFAEGFEETEAIAPVDILRRAGAGVVVAGLDSININSSHSIKVTCDCILEDVLEEHWDAIVIPGGLKGAENLAASKDVAKLLLRQNAEGLIIGAICASPALVLGPLGILNNRKAVCYPGMEVECPSVKFSEQRVLRDSNIITSRGMGCAVEFGLELVRALFGSEKADSVADKIVFGGTR